MTTPSFPVWAPYAIAACLMVVAIEQTHRILELKTQLRSGEAKITQLARSNAMIGLRLTPVESRDAAYQASKVIIAWDPNTFRGVLATQNLPSPAKGNQYQLWVLDPSAPTPINAGTIHPEALTTPFSVNPLSTSYPGFAVTLEPSPGSPEPTSGILFAVPPAQ
jgi:hypothetical protein